jgi:hypothetical protein
MLFEQGDMLTKGSCDPLASKSGAINRLYVLAFCWHGMLAIRALRRLYGLLRAAYVYQPPYAVKAFCNAYLLMAVAVLAACA